MRWAWTVVAILALTAVGCGDGGALETAEGEAAALRSDLAAVESEADLLASELDEAEDAAADARRVGPLENALASASERVVELESELAASHELRNTAVQNARQEVEDRLAIRASDIAEQEADLAQRDAALSGAEQSAASEAAAAPQTAFGAGVYVVGDDIAPGRYRSDGSGDACYWERRTADGESIIDNYVGATPAIATVQAGELFSSQRCGSWSPA